MKIYFTETPMNQNYNYIMLFTRGSLNNKMSYENPKGF